MTLLDPFASLSALMGNRVYHPSETVNLERESGPQSRHLPGDERPVTRVMAEFVIKLADERGRVQEQVQTASTAEELRAT